MAQSTMFPTMRYQDAARMIDWLCEAFGFERHLVVPGENGSVAHAQLRFGNGMLMCGSARDDEWGELVKPVRERGGASASVFAVVTDVDAHCARARKAGAEIVYAPRDTPYGSREYCARDPEGQLWGFGTYDPWA